MRLLSANHHLSNRTLFTPFKTQSISSNYKREGREKMVKIGGERENGAKIVIEERRSNKKRGGRKRDEAEKRE